MKGFLFVFGTCLLAALPASARPTDEVMAGAFRCGVVGNMRAWLDCYYGAAQPVRASLGVPPAPVRQTALAAAPLAGSIPPGEGAVRDQVMLAAARCIGIDDYRQWLNCYYAAAQPARTQLNLPLAPQVSGASNHISPAFGLPTRPAAAVILSNTDHVAELMQSYAFDHYGIFTVTLQDGQVWQQVAGDTNIVHWKRPAQTYQVRISHGLLGSYNLEVRNLPGIFKVRRIS